MEHCVVITFYCNSQVVMLEMWEIFPLETFDKNKSL